MAACSFLLSSMGVSGWGRVKRHILNFNNTERYTKSLIKRTRKPSQMLHHSKYCLLAGTYCIMGGTAPSSALTSVSSLGGSKIPEVAFDLIHNSVLGDLDPDTAKLAIGVLGPFLSAVSFLFILRIVMSWYPKLPVEKFPYVIVYAPTEPILALTRKLIPPLAGVDVTPVVWFGLLSFLNEILVGPQGLFVLLSQQVR